MAQISVHGGQATVSSMSASCYMDDSRWTWTQMLQIDSTRPGQGKGGKARADFWYRVCVWVGILNPAIKQSAYVILGIWCNSLYMA